MKETHIFLSKIEQHTNGKFLFVEDFMNPKKSHAYGHSGFCSVYIRIEGEGEFEVEYTGNGKQKVRVKKEKLLQELERFDTENRLKNIFTAYKKDYSNILRLSAMTINPFHILSLKEKKEKMVELFLKHPDFQTIEQVDLFLLGTGKVSQFISYDSYGHLEVNYFCNAKNSYFILDKEADAVIISSSRKEIENHILSKLNVVQGEKVGDLSGALHSRAENERNVYE